MIKMIDELPKRDTRHRGKVFADIDKFMQSNGSVCEVDTSKNSSAYSARATYQYVSQRYGFPVRATVINGVLYLVKTDKEAEKNAPD